MYDIVFIVIGFKGVVNFIGIYCNEI